MAVADGEQAVVEVALVRGEELLEAEPVLGAFGLENVGILHPASDDRHGGVQQGDSQGHHGGQNAQAMGCVDVEEAKAEDREGEAEEEASRVPHEDLGGMEVVLQEAEDASRQDGGDGRGKPTCPWSGTG